MEKYKVNADILQDWKRREGRTWVWLSRQVGIKPNTLTQQMNGNCGLSLGVALALEKATGIPVQSLVVKAG